MREAGISAKALARAVHEASGGHLPCDHTSVSRWLAGVQPRGVKPRLICEVLSRRLGRAVSPAEAGLAAAPPGVSERAAQLASGVGDGMSAGAGELVGLLAQLEDSSTNDAAVERLSYL